LYGYFLPGLHGGGLPGVYSHSRGGDDLNHTGVYERLECEIQRDSCALHNLHEPHCSARVGEVSHHRIAHGANEVLGAEQRGDSLGIVRGDMIENRLGAVLEVEIMADLENSSRDLHLTRRNVDIGDDGDNIVHYLRVAGHGDAVAVGQGGEGCLLGEILCQQGGDGGEAAGYSGDLAFLGLRILRGCDRRTAKMLEYVYKPDISVQESSYGNSLGRSGRDNCGICFCVNLRRALPPGECFLQLSDAIPYWAWGDLFQHPPVGFRDFIETPGEGGGVRS
jgi:hypothetical protein